MILPPFLEHLTFGYRFNEALQGVDLPKSLRSLTFGSLFNRSLEEVVLPMEMETLTFGFCFNHSVLDHIGIVCIVSRCFFWIIQL